MQNLRAVLEHLARQLVIANNKRPDRNTGFPVIKDPSALTKDWYKRQTGRMHPTHLTLMEGLQPLPGRKGNQFAFLRLLNTLAAHDRHREVQPIIAAAQTISPDVRAVRDCSLLPPSIYPEVFAGPLKPETRFLAVPIHPLGSNPDVQMDYKIEYFVAFEE